MHKFLKSPWLLTLIAMLAIFSLSSCASLKRSTGKTAEATSPKTLTAPLMDADTDAMTGVLQTKGKTEAEKETEKLESEENADRSLRELRRREREEEERRVQRAITDDQKVERQVQTR